MAHIQPFCFFMLKVISNIRFPLCVLIIFMHCDPLQFTSGGELFLAYQNFRLFSLEFIFRLCVPLFFIISGYLFFLTIDEFSFATYKNKIRHRVSSLLIPYFVWNLITLLLYFIGCTLLFPMPSGKPIVEYNIQDFLFCFWDMGRVTGNPEVTGLVIDTPLWFIRDLFIVSLLSPIIYILLKKTKGFILLLPAVLWATESCSSLFAPGDQAIFFFSLGAFGGIKKCNLPIVSSKNASLLLGLYIVSSILLFSTDLFETRWIKHINDLLGIATFLAITSCVTNHNITVHPTLTNSCFFLYAYFQLPLLLTQKIMVPKLAFLGEYGMFLSFFLCGFIVLFIGIGCYYLLKRFAPKLLYNILCGGR